MMRENIDLTRKKCNFSKNYVIGHLLKLGDTQESDDEGKRWIIGIKIEEDGIILPDFCLV